MQWRWRRASARVRSREGRCWVGVVSEETPILLGTPLRMKTRWEGAQSSFVPITSMVHIGTNRAIFGVMGGTASPTARSYLRSPTVASP